MRVLGTSVFVFEAIVVALFIPVAYFTGILTDGSQAAWVGVLMVILCILAAAFVMRPFGVVFGWVVQAVVIASGLVVPMMFVLGAAFGALWVGADLLGRRVERERSRSLRCVAVRTGVMAQRPVRFAVPWSR